MHSIFGTFTPNRLSTKAEIESTSSTSPHRLFVPFDFLYIPPMPLTLIDLEFLLPSLYLARPFAWYVILRCRLKVKLPF